MNINKKLYTLCIETTSNICGISIVLDKKVIYKRDLNLGLNHSITLFDLIIKSFKKLSIDMKDINLIKVSSGPGSFTGIRIGISTALGLAIPYDTKIEYIDTLDTFCKDILMKDSIIISLIDAKNERVYTSIFNSLNHNKLLNDQIIYVKDLVYLINKHLLNKGIDVYLVGPGAKLYEDYIISNATVKSKLKIKNFKIESSNLNYTNGKISNFPIINYVVASKAEREHFDKN